MSYKFDTPIGEIQREDTAASNAATNLNTLYRMFTFYKQPDSLWIADPPFKDGGKTLWKRVSLQNPARKNTDW